MLWWRPVAQLFAEIFRLYLPVRNGLAAGKNGAALKHHRPEMLATSRMAGAMP